MLTLSAYSRYTVYFITDIMSRVRQAVDHAFSLHYGYIVAAIRLTRHVCPSCHYYEDEPLPVITIIAGVWLHTYIPRLAPFEIERAPLPDTTITSRLYLVAIVILSCHVILRHLPFFSLLPS